VKFRRKSAEAAEAESAEVPVEGDDAPTGSGSTNGPWDVDDLPAALEDVERADLGSLLLPAQQGLEIRLQVDETKEHLQAVVLAGPEGAVELRAFAAPRGGDLWAEVRPQIAAEYAQRGGTATERQGPYGTELVCQLTVRTEDGKTATQPSRIVGINGPRWMLRATLLGRPAVEPEAAGLWEAAIASVVVRRGAGAMPVGAELPLTLPPREQLIKQDS
jgi:hypothetical protein